MNDARESRSWRPKLVLASASPRRLALLQQMGGFLSLFYGLSFSMGRDQTSLADRMGRSVVVVARYRPVRQLRG